MVHPRTRELNWNLRGLSITAPHKQTVMECLDWIEPDAKEIGAVNTVVVEGDRLLGYNTDAAGFIDPLLRRFTTLRDARVAIIGAGGAARAAIWALQRQNANVTLFARNVTKAQTLADLFGIACQSLSEASFAGYDLVVNTTPLGLRRAHRSVSGNRRTITGCSLRLRSHLQSSRDLILREARKAGCETLGGLEMLVAQAGSSLNCGQEGNLATDFRG